MGPDPSRLTTKRPDASCAALTRVSSEGGAGAPGAAASAVAVSEPAAGSAVLAWKALLASTSAVSAASDNLPYLLIGLLLPLRGQPLDHVAVGLDESGIVDLLPEGHRSGGRIDRDHAAVVDLVTHMKEVSLVVRSRDHGDVAAAGVADDSRKLELDHQHPGHAARPRTLSAHGALFEQRAEGVTTPARIVGELPSGQEVLLLPQNRVDRLLALFLL